ncbi:MAG: hypothetical protein AB8E82_19360 [Aureispira sp.]
MQEELLDDNLSSEEDYYWMQTLREYQPKLRLLAIVLMLHGLIGVLSNIFYTVLYRMYLEGVFSLFWRSAIDVLVLLIGYRVWQKYQNLQLIEQQGFERAEVICIEYTTKIWQLFAASVALTLLDWLITMIW